MLIENYIYELLQRHDCVVVPNLGGFICNYLPAQIHPVSHRFLPPSKSIRFNGQILKTDGLLAHYVADCESISIQSAIEIIDKYVISIKNDLNHKKEAEIPKIGLLVVNFKGQIFFEANQKENFLLDSFGLESIESPAIFRKKKSVITKNKIIKARNLLEFKEFVNWKVAAVILPLIAFSSFISFQNDLLKETYANYAFLNPFKIKPAKTYSPRVTKKLEIITSPLVIESQIEPSEKVKVQTEKVLPIKKEKKKKSSLQKSKILNPNINNRYSKFHLVAGSFSSKKNAINLSIKLSMEGFDSEIIGQNNQGLYRVVYATFTEKNYAINVLEKLKKEGKDIWLLSQ